MNQIISKTCLIIGCLTFCTVLSANEVLDKLLFDRSMQGLEKAIYKATAKHALYSFNIANITTAGFEPILFPEDQKQLEEMVPVNTAYANKVLLEHMTASMATNRNLQASYLALYKKRIDTYRQIATMGKR